MQSADVLVDHATDVIDAEEDEVIQRRVVQRPQLALNIRQCVRGSVQDPQTPARTVRALSTTTPEMPGFKLPSLA